MVRLKLSLLMLTCIFFFSSGCSIVVGLIASTYERPSSLVVTIESDPPGAEVFLNEKKLGTAPLKVVIEGLSKQHTMVFIKNGYETKIETVSISSGPEEDDHVLSVTRPNGTTVPVADSILNVILQKKEIFP